MLSPNTSNSARGRESWLREGNPGIATVIDYMIVNNFRDTPISELGPSY